MTAKMRAMSFVGPGTGMIGTIDTEHVGVLAALAGSVLVGDFDITVSHAGDTTEIAVVSSTRTAWTAQLKAAMQAAAEPLLLALYLRTGAALRLEWTGANVVAADGQRQVLAWEAVRVAKARDAVLPLGAYAVDAQLIASHDELRSAIEQSAGSIQLAVDQPGASMALAYLAVEGLVTFVRRSTKGSLTSARDWELAAPLLASPPDSLLHLLWSTQLGRHVDPLHAKTELAGRGWPALPATHCCELALDILVAYASTL